MNDLSVAPPKQDSEQPASPVDWKSTLKQSTPYLVALAALTAAFVGPLSSLWRLAINSDLYSHTILIPIVSLYLVWENRNRIRPSKRNRALAAIPVAVGALALYAFFTSGLRPTEGDELESYLAYSIGAYFSFVVAITLFFCGRQAVRTNVFPLLFLVFIVPFSADVKIAIQTFFQHASAEAAYWFIKLSGVPIFRTGLIFEMPRIDMEVAPQCSGIRSTLVLFITSLVGSYFFLRSSWRRATIVLLVIPLGILRNGIRILVLALLCHHYGPEMIDGWFHKHGGQPLFVVTLIPLFVLLYLFWRSEHKSEAKRQAK